ncbi:hypothetical protein CP533_5130 [Ophiocordyceps camponoti-saundersi (nom. inval.)]|nr:hypothetical protein CP533_5130 [Ophiocordyceps camponoti-saundersi (nom. inval.)]
MTGRSRRASTSSVESIDDSRFRWRQEASVVRTIPSDVRSSDDWPIFELRDAVVLNEDGQTLENALHVAHRGPFRIRGHLIIDDPAQKSHLISRIRKSTPLEIRYSTSFAIGESDDRSPLIWVSGRGGWYEISPSTAYGPMYRKMCEATTFYFHMLDLYDSSKALKKSKKTKQPTLRQELSVIFHKYAARVGDGTKCEGVFARCSEHAAFFISQFLQVDASIDWKATSLYKWITTQHSDLAAKIEDKMRNPHKIPPISIEELSPGPASSPFSKSASVEEAALRGLSLKRSSRATSSLAPQPRRLAVREPPKSSAQPPPKTVKEPQKPQVSLPPPPPPPPPPIQASDKPAVPSADDPAFVSVLEALETTMNDLSGSRKGPTPLGVLNKLYFDYSIPMYRDASVGSHRKPAQELLHYYAKPLLQKLDKAKRENQAMYSWLEELAATEFQPVVFKPSDFPVTLFPRQRKPRTSNKNGPPPPPPPPASAPPPAEAMDQDPDEVDDDDDQSIIDAAAARRSKGLKRHGRRKKSYLRPAAGKRKRSHSQIESDAESNGSGGAARNSHYFSDNHQGENDDDDKDEDEDDIMEDAPTSDANDHEDSTSQQTVVVIRAERIPETSARGPDETWRCDQDGCDYMVRASDDSEGQARIRAHHLDHTQQLERLSLAVTESRGHMPINHLLDKIKRMGEKSLPNGQDNSLPTPIKRKLIV